MVVPEFVGVANPPPRAIDKGTVLLSDLSVKGRRLYEVFLSHWAISTEVNNFYRTIICTQPGSGDAMTMNGQGE